MKETPIIMSGDHPKLILDGLKTMTRRVIKPQPDEVLGGQPYILPGTIDLKPQCPYGQVGDRLWVRETHFIGGIKPDEWAWYKAGFDGDAEAVVWRPSIFMPHWASRITLEITEVRVERVQEISLVDIKREGISPDGAIYNPLKEVANFQVLWDSLNAKRGYGWEVNPWCWVISFRRLNA